MLLHKGRSLHVCSLQPNDRRVLLELVHVELHVAIALGPSHSSK